MRYLAILRIKWLVYRDKSPYMHYSIVQGLFNIGGSVFAEKPHKDIHNFVGNFTMVKNPLHTI